MEATGACASTGSTAGAVLHGGRVGRVGQERVHRAGVVDPGSLLPPTRRRRAVTGATSTLGRNTGPAQKRTYRPAPRPATPLHLSIEAPSRSGPNPESVGPPAPAGPLTASSGAVVVRRQYGLRCTLRLFSAKDGDPGPLARGKAQSLGYRGERRARPATNQPCVVPNGPQKRSPVPLGPSMGTLSGGGGCRCASRKGAHWFLRTLPCEWLTASNQCPGAPEGVGVAACGPPHQRARMELRYFTIGTPREQQWGWEAAQSG